MNITIERAVVEQALEAWNDPQGMPALCKAMDALRSALEQPQEQPPCKTHPDAPHGFCRDSSHSADRYVCECEFWEEPQQEPVAWISESENLLSWDKFYDHMTPLYTHPAPRTEQPPIRAELLCVCGCEWQWENREWELVATPPMTEQPWVGLTDEEYSNLHEGLHQQGKSLGWVVDQVEAILKERNT